MWFLVCPHPNQKSWLRLCTRGGGIWGLVPPNHCLCPPSESKLLYSSTREPAKFCPKTGHHKRFFFYETARQIEGTWSSSLRFCDEDLFLFYFFRLHLQIWGQNPYSKEDYIECGGKYSPDCCCILSVSPQKFCAPPKCVWSRLRKRPPKSFVPPRNTLLWLQACYYAVLLAVHKLYCGLWRDSKQIITIC